MSSLEIGELQGSTYGQYRRCTRRGKMVEAVGAAKDIGQNNCWNRVGTSWMGSGEEEGKLMRSIFCTRGLRLSRLDNLYGILEDIESFRAKGSERKPKKRQSRFRS